VLFQIFSRIIIALQWRLTLLRRFALKLFPPKRIRFELDDLAFEIKNPTRIEYTDRWILEPGVWERKELTLFARLAQKSGFIFDVGANLGVYAIAAAKINSEANVFAFEPYPANYHHLVANLSMNGCMNAMPFELALGDTVGKISFFVPRDPTIVTSVASVNEGYGDAIEGDNDYVETEISQTTIDAFVLERGIERIDLMKIDVENHELAVLEGGVQSLKRFRPAIICEVLMPEALKERFPGIRSESDLLVTDKIETLISSLGYYLYSIGENGLLRVDSLNNHPDDRNYLFSTVRSETRFLGYSNLQAIYKLLPLD
jgi:FkbM family methyltransferase